MNSTEIMMEDTDFERLRDMLDRLPKFTRITARTCWSSIQLDNLDDEIVGIKWAGWAYKQTISFKPRARMSPNESEREFNRISASAVDLLNKLTQANPECMRLIGEAEPRWADAGMHLADLKALANITDKLAEEVALKKQAPNGRRERFHERPVDWLLVSIGRVTKFRGRPMSHVIPIARKVHEWATQEIPGEDWGNRPFERVKSYINALKLNPSLELVVPAPRDKGLVKAVNEPELF